MGNPTLTSIRKQVADGVLPESALEERLRYDLRCAERRAASLRKELAQREKTAPCGRSICSAPLS